MTKLKRITTVILAIIMLCSIFAGCSQQKQTNSLQNNSQDSQTSEQKTEITPKKNITLKVWGAIAEEKGPGDLIQAFMEKNPGVKVEYIMFKNDEIGRASCRERV